MPAKNLCNNSASTSIEGILLRNVNKIHYISWHRAEITPLQDAFYYLQNGLILYKKYFVDVVHNFYFYIAKYFFSFLILTCLVPICKGQEKSVLFIGNSLTYFHDMPKTVQKMINEKNINVKIKQSTFPGYRLFNHFSKNMNITLGSEYETRYSDDTTETIKKILSQNWDVVILQDALPLCIDIVKQNLFRPYLSKFDSIIKMKHGKTALFEIYIEKIKYPTTHCYPADFIFKYSFPKNKDILEQKEYCSKLINSKNE